MMDFIPYMIDFVLNMMGFILNMMGFTLKKTRIFILNIMNSILKKMDDVKTPRFNKSGKLIKEAPEVIRLLQISIEMAAFSVLFSMEKAAISISMEDLI